MEGGPNKIQIQSGQYQQVGSLPQTDGQNPVEKVRHSGLNRLVGRVRNVFRKTPGQTRNRPEQTPLRNRVIGKPVSGLPLTANSVVPGG